MAENAEGKKKANGPQFVAPAEWECVQTLDRASRKTKQKRAQAAAKSAKATSSHISLPLAASKPFSFLKEALLPQKLLQLKQKSQLADQAAKKNQSPGKKTLAHIKEVSVGSSSSCEPAILAKAKRSKSSSLISDHPAACDCRRCCPVCRKAAAESALSANGKSKSDDSLYSNTASVASCSSCCSICCTENYSEYADCQICQQLSGLPPSSLLTDENSFKPFGSDESTEDSLPHCGCELCKAHATSRPLSNGSVGGQSLAGSNSVLPGISIFFALLTASSVLAKFSSTFVVSRFLHISCVVLLPPASP